MKLKLFLTLFILASLATTGQTITFNGESATDVNNWHDADNWDLDIVPTAAHDVVIPTTFTARIKNGSAVANTLDIASGGLLELNPEISIAVTGDVTLGGNHVVVWVDPATTKNMATFSFGGTVSNQFVVAAMTLPANDKWSLMGVPLSSAQRNYSKNSSNFATNDTDGNGINTDGGGALLSVGTYDDSGVAGSKYTYNYPNVTRPGGNFVDGLGYSVLTNHLTDLSLVRFRGKLNDADVDGPNMVYGGNGFLLVGNPYPTYLYANDNANVSNVLVENSAELAEQTIWLWDSVNEDWITKNQSDPAYHIAPGQGYFVKVKSDALGTVPFKTKEDMQTHTKNGTVYLKSANNRFTIDLSISKDTKEGVIVRKTAVRYIDNTTADFDNGFDSSMFGGYESELSVSTELLENSTGQKLAIQSLPNLNYEEMVIPVSVSAAAGSEITFTADAINVPSGYHVYLEDRTNNTFTLLDEINAEYKTTVAETVTDGRFYIHTSTSSVLSVDSELLDTVSIFKTTNNNLRIAGLSQGDANVSVFNILGKKVFNSSFSVDTTVKNISLPSLATGVYIVQLQTEAGKLSKKIIME